MSRAAGTLVTTNNATYVPPRFMPGYRGYCPSIKFDYGEAYGNATAKYFQDYRDTVLTSSASNYSPGGSFPTYYTHNPDLVISNRSRNQDRWLLSPKYELSNMDHDRTEQLRSLHHLSQKHREFYKDKSGKLKTVDHFKIPFSVEDQIHSKDVLFAYKPMSHSIVNQASLCPPSTTMESTCRTSSMWPDASLSFLDLAHILASKKEQQEICILRSDNSRTPCFFFFFEVYFFPIQSTKAYGYISLVLRWEWVKIRLICKMLNFGKKWRKNIFNHCRLPGFKLPETFVNLFIFKEQFGMCSFKSALFEACYQHTFSIGNKKNPNSSFAVNAAVGFLGGVKLVFQSMQIFLQKLASG